MRDNYTYSIVDKNFLYQQMTCRDIFTYKSTYHKLKVFIITLKRSTHINLRLRYDTPKDNEEIL